MPWRPVRCGTIRSRRHAPDTRRVRPHPPQPPDRHRRATPAPRPSHAAPSFLLAEVVVAGVARLGHACCTRLRCAAGHRFSPPQRNPASRPAPRRQAAPPCRTRRGSPASCCCRPRRSRAGTACRWSPQAARTVLRRGHGIRRELSASLCHAADHRDTARGPSPSSVSRRFANAAMPSSPSADARKQQHGSHAANKCRQMLSAHDPLLHIDAGTAGRADLFPSMVRRHPSTVMVGIVPAIRRGTVSLLMAGTSPAIRNERAGNSWHSPHRQSETRHGAAR